MQASMNFRHIAIVLMMYLYTTSTAIDLEDDRPATANNSNSDYFNDTGEYESATEDSGMILNISNLNVNWNSSSGSKLHAILNEISTTEDFMSILDPDFIACQHLHLDPEHYEKLDNGSVFVPLFNMQFNRSHHFFNNGTFFYCPNFYKEFGDSDKFSSALSTVSIVCIGISSACIQLHIIMFVLVRRLRNLPGYILLSLCFALLAAYICSFVQYFISEHIDCVVIGMFLLYFFLSSFFWMNMMAYDVWRSIRMATAKFRLTGDRPIMVRFARYSLYGWGVPLLIIIISIIVHNTSPDVSRYKLTFNMDNCWFLYKQALTVYFAVPLFSLLGMNVVFFVSSFYMILSSSMSKSQSGCQNGADLWSRLFLSLRLGSTMGFMWIFGIIAAFTEQEWLWYLYAICNALQGVFIFFSFTVSERTRKACRKALKASKCSVSPTQTSSQPCSAV